MSSQELAVLLSADPTAGPPPQNFANTQICATTAPADTETVRQNNNGNLKTKQTGGEGEGKLKTCSRFKSINQ